MPSMNLESAELNVDMIVKIADAQLDITAPQYIHVTIEKDVMWVNVNGVCAFRACRIQELVVEDNRK